jgi:hypothetical protein
MLISELINDTTSLFKNLENKIMQKIRVASPAVISEVDYEKQTLKAQITIREYINGKYIEIPELLDVPFFILGGGDYSITMPIKKGDECLIIFGDSCVDSWWQNGDIQNPIDSRRHDLSDGFALVGFKSQKNKLEDYNDEAFQIRKEDEIPFEINDDSIIITKDETEIIIEDDNITISTNENTKITIDSNGKVEIEASEINLKGTVKINDKNFMSHTHSNGNQGANTGGVIA